MGFDGTVEVDVDVEGTGSDEAVEGRVMVG
jgi:hypothetical protein